MNAAMEDRTTIEWDKDDLDALGLLKVDVLALGMLTALRKGFDLLDRHYGERLTLADHPAGGARRLRDDPARRHDRRVPDREPRADVDAAAAQAGEILRSRHRGRDRAARPDPGRHGASLSAPPAGPRGGRLSLARSSKPVLEQDARRAAVPGTGDEDRHRRGRLHAGRGRPAAPRDGDVPPRRHDPDLSGQDDRGHGGQGLRPRVRRALLPADRGLRRIRLSREPCGELRAAGLRLVLDEMPLSRRLRRGDAQRPAARLLRARAARARRARAWRRGARGRRQPVGLGLHAGAATLLPCTGRGLG